MSSGADSFPVRRWLQDMDSAVDEIGRVGDQLLIDLKENNAEAADNAERWHLPERHRLAGTQLRALMNSLRQIIESIETCRHHLAEKGNTDEETRESMVATAGVIAPLLPIVDACIVDARHCALDLIRWAKRSGNGRENELSRSYRDSFRGLMQYSHAFRPMMDSFQRDLIRLDGSEGIHPETHELISLVARYNSVMDSGKAVLRSIVEPEMELAFHETEAFLKDIRALEPDRIASLATEINDCCQKMLYDRAGFNAMVEHVRPNLAEGVDASLSVLPVCGHYRVIFSIDEDPLFEELSVTLYRLLDVDRLRGGLDLLVQSLYAAFSDFPQETSRG